MGRNGCVRHEPPINWDCDQNPPATEIRIQVISPSDTQSSFAALPVVGQVAATEIGVYSLSLVAAIDLAGKRRGETADFSTTSFKEIAAMSSNLRSIVVPVLITAIGIISSFPKKAMASSMIGKTIHHEAVVCPAQAAAETAKDTVIQKVLGAVGGAGLEGLSTDSILNSVKKELFWDKKGKVYLTEGGQLVGSHDALRAFRSAHPEYSRWDSHHIVEQVHLRNLGKHYSDGNALPAVLIPNKAHSGRIRSIVGRADCLSLNARGLYSYYKEAYELLGAYTGGRATGAGIQAELLAIVRTMLGI